MPPSPADSSDLPGLSRSISARAQRTVCDSTSRLAWPAKVRTTGYSLKKLQEEIKEPPDARSNGSEQHGCFTLPVGMAFGGWLGTQTVNFDLVCMKLVL